jgi:hypothetical protein
MNIIQHFYFFARGVLTVLAFVAFPLPASTACGPSEAAEVVVSLERGDFLPDADAGALVRPGCCFDGFE